MVIMEVITVTSKNQDPANFVSNFTNSIQLSGDCEVALLKIALPPVANVTKDNNKLYLVSISKVLPSQLTLEIPTGFYATGHDLAQAMHKVLTEYKPKHEEVERGIDSEEIKTESILRYSTTASISNYKVTLQLEDKHRYNKTRFSANDDTEGNILRLLDFKITNFMAKTLTIHNDYLAKQNKLGFIYSSIVSNSLIDDRISRLLDTVEINNSENGGYSIIENQNPVFHNVSVASFIDISFEIYDVRGELIEFAKNLPTIMTLGIRKKPILSI